MLRAIHIFPSFENLNLVEELREKYDPLFGLIPPHITLVFPFKSEIPTDVLEEHLRSCVQNIPPFPIALQGITGSNGEYLFLNLKKGNDQIIELHDRMYTGILKPFLDRAFSYTPHVTVGRLSEREAFEKALCETEDFMKEFNTPVKEIVVEIIGSDDSSIIELVIAF